MRLIRLSGNFNISGTIPSDYGTFSGLMDLNLAGLSLTGTVPAELETLMEHLNFSSLDLSGTTLLSGEIPSRLCQISNRTCTWKPRACGLFFDCLADGDDGRGLCGCDCPCPQ